MNDYWTPQNLTQLIFGTNFNKDVDLSQNLNRLTFGSTYN
jgi:hypothetical protein